MNLATVKKNWKTSLGGLGLLLLTIGNAVIQYTGGGFAAVDLKQFLAGLTAAFVAFAAKDGDQTGLPAAPVP
jgi:hypothetical protein